MAMLKVIFSPLGKSTYTLFRSLYMSLEPSFYHPDMKYCIVCASGLVTIEQKRSKRGSSSFLSSGFLFVCLGFFIGVGLGFF